MKKILEICREIIVTAGILSVCFALCLAIHTIFERNVLIPSIFVLGVFLISAVTHGYVYGTVAADVCSGSRLP